MASQVEAAYCFKSVVRGHHIYKTIWTPSLGEILMVFPEPLNDHDRLAVYIKKDDVIVGHVPREQAMRLVDGSLNSCHEIQPCTSILLAFQSVIFYTRAKRTRS